MCLYMYICVCMYIFLCELEHAYTWGVGDTTQKSAWMHVAGDIGRIEYRSKIETTCEMIRMKLVKNHFIAFVERDL